MHCFVSGTWIFSLPTILLTIRLYLKNLPPTLIQILCLSGCKHYFQMLNLWVHVNYLVTFSVLPISICNFNLCTQVTILISPAKRAYSWYQHAKAHGDPTTLKYSFYQVITANESVAPKPLRDLRNRLILIEIIF